MIFGGKFQEKHDIGATFISPNLVHEIQNILWKSREKDGLNGYHPLENTVIFLVKFVKQKRRYLAEKFAEMMSCLELFLYP